MEEPPLQIAVWIVQLLGFALASYSAFLAYRAYRTSRDVQVAINLSESFRSSWEKGWRKSLNAVAGIEAANRTSDLSYKQHEEQLNNMLNWIDWVGTLMEAGLLSKNMTLLGSIKDPLVRILEVSRPIIDEDVKDQGPDFWRGVLTVAQRLDIEWAEKLSENPRSAST